MTTEDESIPTSDLSEDGSMKKIHWRVVITAGMGFFTDAYDLFVIGTVSALLKPLWNLTTTEVALLNSGALVAAAFGAVLFGYWSDKFGRKKMYGIESMILFLGAVFSAISPAFIFLLISRIFVGFGIGGDYPSSASVASEYAHRKNRGYLVLLVFGMQALGLLVGPLIASILLLCHISPLLTCKILLGLGAIPAFYAFYLRRKLAETPRYLLQQAPVEVSRVTHAIATPKKLGDAPKPPRKAIAQELFSKKWLPCLIGTASAWFLLDVAFYGNGISSLIILKKMSPDDDDRLFRTLMSALMFLFFAFPGYVLAAKNVDRIGRKPLQIGGFIMMALCFGAIALIPALREEQNIWLFVLIFGISFFFTNFGPNTTTFLIPSEVFPTSIRAKAHGLSAAIGKVGAFVAAFGFPFILDNQNGLSWIFGITGAVALLGCLSTLLIPEMKQKSIDSLEEYS